MDPQLPQDKREVFEAPSEIRRHVIKKIGTIFVSILLVSLFSLGGYYFYENYSKKPVIQPAIDKINQTINPVEDPYKQPLDKKIALVGSESLYQSDLNNRLSLYYPAFAQSPTKDQATIDDAFEDIIEQSLILQEAQKKKLILLTSTTFSGPKKDLVQRSILYEKAKASLEDSAVSNVSGEVLTVWFRNPSYPDPSIGVENAEKLAKDKITTLRDTILKQNISFKQASNLITSDSSLASIDPSYKANAYRIFKDYDRSTPFFIDPSLNTQVWELSVNEVSPVMIGSFHDSKANKTYPTHFILVRLSEKKVTSTRNYEELITQLKQQYEVKKY